MATSEVILIISDIVLDMFFDFGHSRGWMGGILEGAPFRGSWDELGRITLEKLV